MSNHPSEVAYEAGVVYALAHPEVPMSVVRAEARKYDDPDAFIDGYCDNARDV